MSPSRSSNGPFASPGAAMTMDYESAWRYLDELQFFKMKLGLDSLRSFCRRIGDPQQELSCVHVAGTNGKGSVAATIAAILQAASYRCGLYTSPHLNDVRERFRVNGRMITREEFTAAAAAIIEALGGEQITYFEFTTALAFVHFVRRQVDIAVLEVGLGGRLDATNIVTPKVAVITNISMDHEAHLGTTIAEVAAEKAGIIKPGVPVVSGVLDPEAAAVVAEQAAERRAPLYCLGRDFSLNESAAGRRYQGLAREVDGIQLALRGPYQAANTAVALAAVEVLGQGGVDVDDQALGDGVSRVRWPGRLEEIVWTSPHGPRTVLLDGAHNPAGVAALIDYLRGREMSRDLTVVWASMADKDIGRCLLPVSRLAATMIFTRPEENRSAPPRTLATVAREGGYGGRIAETASVDEALALAAAAGSDNGLILVAGSLYLVGAVRARLVAGEEEV